MILYSWKLFKFNMVYFTAKVNKIDNFWNVNPSENTRLDQETNQQTARYQTSSTRETNLIT